MVARFGPVGGPPSPTKTAGNCSVVSRSSRSGGPVVVQKAGNGSGHRQRSGRVLVQRGLPAGVRVVRGGALPQLQRERGLGLPLRRLEREHGLLRTNPCGFTVPCGNPDPGICPNPSETLPSITATFALNNPPPPPPPPRYNTVLLNHPPKTTRSRRATFGWGAKLNGSFRSSFKSQCKLGSKPWASCRPGKDLHRALARPEDLPRPRRAARHHALGHDAGRLDLEDQEVARPGRVRRAGRGSANPEAPRNPA